MSKSTLPSQGGILLHPCCLMHLMLSNYLDEILQTLPAVFLSQDVYEREEIFSSAFLEKRGMLRRSSSKKGLEAERISQKLSLLPLAPGLLGRVIDLAVLLGGDSEGYNAALATEHGLMVGMDSPHTIDWFQRHAPHLTIISTPVLINQWRESAAVPVQTVAQAIRNVSQIASYGPPASHPLASWWRKTLELAPQGNGTDGR